MDDYASTKNKTKKQNPRKLFTVYYVNLFAQVLPKMTEGKYSNKGNLTEEVAEWNREFKQSLSHFAS